VAYEKVFRNVLFPVFDSRLKGRGTVEYLREYDRQQWLDRGAVERLALEKLNRLLTHCWDTVPYLRRRWSLQGLDARPLESLADLARYPVIDKTEITANYAEMVSSVWRGRTYAKATGGSTGTPFRFEFTVESDARRNAVMWRGYRWAGADIGRRTAFLWGTGFGGSLAHRTKDWLYHRTFNRMMLDAFRLAEDNAGQYVRALNAFKPRIVIGYVAPLVALAKWAIDHGSSLRAPESVITGAEALHEDQRQTISNAFGCPVFNTYGSREFMLIAAECELRDGLHTNSDHLVVETVDAEGMPVDGQPGDVAITDLHNFGMPFVRYRNGDLATATARECGCGRGLPLVERIDGRRLDMIRTPDGRMLPGEFFPHLMKEFAFVQQFQVVQRRRDAVEVSIVPTATVDEAALATLRKEINGALGGQVRVETKVVENIPLTASGKRRVTISLLDSQADADVAVAASEAGR
jgi:phenylacetate-CoA ligase